jgi:proteasome lid subunit RPN8/RPN11
MIRPRSDGGLILGADHVERLMAHAQAELPHEACALLGGRRSTGVATSVHLTRNALASPLRFEVDPGDLVRTMLTLDEAGLDLLAIFHSHTRSAAVPSPADIRENHYRALHLIASLSDRERPLRAWQIDRSTSSEIPLTINGGRVLSPARGGGRRPSAGG